MEESQEELISPRISFSYDLLGTPPPPAAAALAAGRRSDSSLLVSRSSRLPAEPEFDFANAVAAGADDDVAPADRLFAGGKLLPMPPLPRAAPKPTSPRKPQACSSRVKAQQEACQQQRRQPGSSWVSPFSRSSSVNSATTTTTATTGAPRSAGRFGCPPFPLMRSWSVGSAATVARDGPAALVGADAAGHRPHHHQYYKKFGGAAGATGNGGGGSRAYYYGGSRKGSSGHGVRVRPVLNVPFIGVSVSNVLSYLLCDCSSHRTKKSREFLT